MLTEKEKDLLHRQGYLDLGCLLSSEQVNKVNQRIFDLMKVEGDNAGSELMDSKYIRHPKEAGADRLANLVNKGDIFDTFYTHPKVLAGIEAVLGTNYKLSSLNYRAATPGNGKQKLHVDWGNTVVNEDYKVCNTIWLLDEFTTVNGATRIVPGTHKLKSLPQNILDNPLNDHPEQVLITAPAGSVFIFNSHVWHGGTTNFTNKNRRSIHSYFCSRELPQQIDQKKYITQATRQRIGQKGEWLLGL
ncbi:MAG: ectoine hydroxylase-related dioxygenase (phytanoyl-CoA dioxygenase family) [Algoriphagus sp.]|jgi:ectoine hydroxylase-related dioxygenase (phytanoyl-CoA dioxygenase family)